MRTRASLMSVLALLFFGAVGWGLYAPAAVQGREPAQEPLTVDLVGRLDAAGFSTAISGVYAYVPTPSWQLLVVDVSNPARPVEVARYPMPYAQSVLVYGQYAYVGASQDGVHILDISTPTAPREVGSYPVPAGASAHGLALRMPYLYVAGGFGGVRVVDVSNPTSPVEVGSYSRPQAMWSVYNVVVDGTYLYAGGVDADGPTRGQGGMRVIDVSVPSNPKEVGYYLAYQSTKLAISGNRAYLIGIPGLHIIDIQDPANPVGLGTFDAGSGNPVNTVAVSGKYAYLVSYSGLHVIDVSSPASPTQVALYATPASGTFGIALAGLYIYLSDSTKGISILRFSDAASALEARSFLPGILAGNAGP